MYPLPARLKHRLGLVYPLPSWPRHRLHIVFLTVFALQLLDPTFWEHAVRPSHSYASTGKAKQCTNRRAAFGVRSPPHQRDDATLSNPPTCHLFGCDAAADLRLRGRAARRAPGHRARGVHAAGPTKGTTSRVAAVCTGLAISLVPRVCCSSPKLFVTRTCWAVTCRPSYCGALFWEDA